MSDVQGALSTDGHFHHGRVIGTTFHLSGRYANAEVTHKRALSGVVNLLSLYMAVTSTSLD